MLQRADLVKRGAIVPTLLPQEGILIAYSPSYKILSTHGSSVRQVSSLSPRGSNQLACLPIRPSMVVLHLDQHNFL